MQAKMKTKIIPLLMLVFVMGMMMFAVPVVASAEEPPDEGEYTEYIGGYEYYDGYYDDEYVELPDEYEYYYPNYEPVFEDGANPFSPDGTGTVIDNATDEDGKEFYTIETPDGNIFYLIIDRQRSTDNVYFLGAVTEEDLMSLAQITKKPDTPSGAVLPDDIEPDEVVTDAETTEQDSTTTPMTAQGNDDLMLYIVLGIAVAGIGGAAYYFKIAKPKREGTVTYDDDYGEDYDDDEDNEDFEDEEDGFDEETPDEDGFEESYGSADDGFDIDAPDYVADGYNRDRNNGQAASPPPQGNRSSRRRHKKRRKLNYSG